MKSTKYSKKMALGISIVMAAAFLSLFVLLESYGKREVFAWPMLPGWYLTLMVFGTRGGDMVTLFRMHVGNFLVYTLIFYFCVRLVRTKAK